MRYRFSEQPPPPDWFVLDAKGEVERRFTNAPVAAESAVDIGGSIRHRVYGDFDLTDCRSISGLVFNSEPYLAWLRGLPVAGKK